MTTAVVRAEKMAAGGDAIARLADGRVVFVRGALPLELVSVTLLSEKRDYAKAIVAEIIEPSPHRVAPPCPELARGCGGCAWQHVAPDAQLQLKLAVVGEALRRTGGLVDAHLRAAGAVPAWGYRTSLRLAVDPSGRAGLRATASNRVVPLSSCAVAHPLLASLLPTLRVRGADEVSLRVGVASGQRSAWADGHGVAVAGLPDDVAVGPRSFVHETVAGHSLRVSAPSFFQSGPAAAELLVTAVRESCGDALDAGYLLDAYGGIGLFAATLGDQRVHVVEGARSACDDAVMNLAGRDALVECVELEQWEPCKVPLVIADPARSGLGATVIDRLVATRADRLVLVSCDPVSLARDSRLLAERGYVHIDSQVLDLFPNTPHVEVVTRFDRLGGRFLDGGHPAMASAP